MAVNQNHDGWHSGEFWDSQQLRNIRWTVPVRYQNVKYIGHGAFGAVMKATDTQTGKIVAIKSLFHPFLSPEHSKRTYRELKLLQHVNHPQGYIVQLYNVFTPAETLAEFNEIYFVLNFVDCDVYRVIQKNALSSEDREGHISQIIYSILCGLKYLHSANIIHRDITPKNIGITKKSNVYILDFGLSRVVPNDLGTQRVVARWWRAPEVMMNPRKYTDKLDIWSVGCIMAEMIRGTPLFPGQDSKDQLRRILTVLSIPKKEQWKKLCTEEAYRPLGEEMAHLQAQDFRVLFPDLSDNGRQFLESLLRLDPDERLTAEQALAHAFLADYRDPRFEFTGIPLKDPHDGKDYTVEQWKELTWALIQDFREPAWAATSEPKSES